MRSWTGICDDIELLDDRFDYGEDGFVIMGMAEHQVVLFVTYT